MPGSEHKLFVKGLTFVNKTGTVQHGPTCAQLTCILTARMLPTVVRAYLRKFGKVLAVKPIYKCPSGERMRLFGWASAVIRPVAVYSILVS